MSRSHNREEHVRDVPRETLTKPEDAVQIRAKLVAICWRPDRVPSQIIAEAQEYEKYING